MFLPISLKSQNLNTFNQKWEKETSLPSEIIDFNNSIIDDSLNIYITGNHTLSNGQIALLLEKFSSSGSLLWSQNWTCSNCLGAYGADLYMDSSFIYVVGAVQTNTSSLSFDILVQKYNIYTGNLVWTNSFDVGGDTEFPVDITVNNGNVFLVGVTKPGTNGYDAFIAKINGSGTSNWLQVYDHLGFDDIPVEISLDGTGVEILIASSVNSTDWEIAILNYNDSGILHTETRSNEVGFDRDKPLTYFRYQDSLYVGGTAIDTSTSSQNGYIKKYGIGTSITLDWTQSITVEDRNETVLGIERHSNGNVYATGGAEDENGKNWTWISKLNETNGTVIWQRIRAVPPAEDIISGRYFSVDSEGDPIIALRHVTDNTTIYLSQYNSNGSRLWEKPLISSGSEVQATNLIIPNEKDIFLVGILGKPNGSQVYYLTALEKYKKPNNITYDSNGGPLYITEDLIIRFSACVLDTTFINDNTLTYANVSEVVTDTSLVAEMDNRLGANGELENWKLFKIYKTFNTTTTTIQGRTGETVNIPPLWATLLLEIGSSSQIKEPPKAADTLSSLSKEYIVYTHPNFIVGPPTPPPPIDPLYILQKSLFSATNPIAHINVENAWNILDNAGWSNGLYDDGLNIALVDSGVRFQHEDLRCSDCPGLNTGDEDQSIVVEALSFSDLDAATILDLSSDDADVQDNDLAPEGHGTRTAGVIAAIRGNELGIKGISSDPGRNVRINSYRYIDPDQLPSGTVGYLISLLGFIANCENTETYDCSNRANLDIICNEVQIRTSGTSPAGSISEEESKALREVVELLYDAGYINTGARGNYGNNNLVFPAGYTDRWMINVGGSGSDGQIVVLGINDENESAYSSSYGNGMDIIAPGINDLVHTTSNNSNNAYSSFNGTSAALPHVTATSAMVMLHHPTPLAQEDVEHLLEYTATDRGDLGFDEDNGWGILNAGNALSFIDPSGGNYRVIQAELVGSLSFDDDPFGCGNNCAIVIEGGERELEDTGAGVIFYEGTIRKYSQSFSIDISSLGDGLTPPPSFLDSDPMKLPFWTRSANTNLWFSPLFESGGYTFTPDNHLFFESGTQINGNIFSGTISGYSIILETDDAGNSFQVICTDGKQTVSSNTPVNINECYYGQPRLTFSFLAKDPVTEVPPQVIDVVTTTRLPQSEHSTFHIFPNPTQEMVNISVMSSEDGIGQLTMYNAQGGLIKKQNIYLHSGVEINTKIDLSNQPNGIYCIKFTQGQWSQIKKVIKQ